MDDETFFRRAAEENSQSIAAGAIPIIDRCPACESADIGFNETENHKRYYCRACTTTWSPNLIQQVIAAQDAQSVSAMDYEGIGKRAEIVAALETANKSEEE